MEELESLEKQNVADREYELYQEQLDRMYEDYESFTEQNNLKKTVSRSFSRKLNLGNYETADFFCAYSQEVVGATPLIEFKKISHQLYIEARHDVLRAIESFKTMSKVELSTLYDMVRKGIAIPMDTWNELSISEQNLLHKAQLLREQETRISAKKQNGK